MGNYLNNYRKKPFIPIIQKTSTLITLSLLSLICFIVSMNFKTIEVSASHDFKIKAANLMDKSLKTLKYYRLEKSVFIDSENDSLIFFGNSFQKFSGPSNDISLI